MYVDSVDQPEQILNLPNGPLQARFYRRSDADRFVKRSVSRHPAVRKQKRPRPNARLFHHGRKGLEEFAEPVLGHLAHRHSPERSMRRKSSNPTIFLSLVVQNGLQ
jgi:hypothetical protein